MIPFHLFSAPPSQLLSLGQEADVLSALYGQPLPHRLGIEVVGFYSPSEDAEPQIETLQALSQACDTLEDLLRYEGFRREFCPAGVEAITVLRTFMETPPSYWFAFPDVKAAWCTNGLALQLAFFDADRNPTERQRFSLAFAMGYLDHWIDLTGELDPSVHEPLPASRELAEEYARAVGNVFGGRLGKWSAPLAAFRNLVLVGLEASAEAKPIVWNMRRFAASGHHSYLQYAVADKPLSALVSPGKI